MDSPGKYLAEVSLPAEVEEVPCNHATDCGAVHRRLTGRKFVHLEVAGHRFTAELVAGTDKWEALNG